MDPKASSVLPREGLTSTTLPSVPQGAGRVPDASAHQPAQGFTLFNASVLSLDGHSGFNFLQMSPHEASVAYTLDLTRSAVLSRVKSFHSIDLTGTINNTIKLNWAAVAILSDAFDASSAPAGGSARMLVVSGNVGDALHLVNLSSWSVGALQTSEELSAAHGHAHQFLPGHVYRAYTLYGATVFVDAAMEVGDAPTSSDAQVTSQVFSIEELFGPQGNAPQAVPEKGEQADRQAEGADRGSFKGVAIVFAGTGGVNGDIHTMGHYQLSKDGGASWMSVPGDLSDAAAVYADKTALLRYVGAEEAGRIQPQSLMVRLIDDSALTGLAHDGAASTGSTIDVSVHGVSTAFGADAFSLLARSSKARMSNAPDERLMETGGDVLAPVGEVGSPVSSLVGAGDGLGDKGIAITGVDTTQGTLYYSTNGGSTWTEVTSPLSERHTLFMRSDSGNRVYFKPSAGLSVHSGNALTIRSWDQLQDTESIFFKATTDSPSLLVAEASLESDEAQAAVSSVQDIMADGRAPAAPLADWPNKPDKLSNEALAAVGLTAEGLAQEATVEVTAEEVAAAIAASVNASMAKVYAETQSERLDLGALLSQTPTNGVQAEPGALDMGSDSASNVLHLTLADVLSLPVTNGVHQLVLTGTANDKLMLSKGEWTDTGTVVTQDGHSYAVYTGTSDSTAQLLIDQQILMSSVS